MAELHKIEEDNMPIGKVEGDDVVRLVTTNSPQQAHLWRQALEEEGIRCRVVGDYLGGIVSPGNPVPEIWVHQEDAERALAILDETGKLRSTRTESEKGRQITTITGQRVLVALVVLAGIIGVYLVPSVWQHPLGNVLTAVVFGAVLLDWMWLRFIKPNTERRDGGNGAGADGQR